MACVLANTWAFPSLCFVSSPAKWAWNPPCPTHRPLYQSTELISSKIALQTFEVLSMCERRNGEASAENGKVSFRFEVSTHNFKITVGIEQERKRESPFSRLDVLTTYVEASVGLFRFKDMLPATLKIDPSESHREHQVLGWGNFSLCRTVLYIAGCLASLDLPKCQ